MSDSNELQPVCSVVEAVEAVLGSCSSPLPSPNDGLEDVVKEMQLPSPERILKKLRGKWIYFQIETSFCEYI